MKLLTKRSFFSSYNERDHYYKSLIVKNTVESSYQAVSRVYPGITETYKDVIFKDLLWGTTSRDVIHSLGSPRYKVDKLNDLTDHQILFFKREIMDQKTVMQCHFLHNQLYFLHIDFLSSLSKELEMIQQMIYRKYALNNTPGVPGNAIKDCYQNKLIINNDVILSLSYISGMPSVAKILEKQLQRKSVTEKERILNKLSEL
jgi:hypothetical protein